MPDKIKREDLVFDDSVKVNSKGEAILGRLYGPVAEFIAPTRNGRMYDEETWDKVFKKPLVKEMFEAGGLLGELNHPEDRLETDLSKVCVCMPEPPKKNKDGCLTAMFDILDTPNGRIVETLAKYGYKLGVSSRADGDTFEGYDGVSHVDSDTFDLKGFDIVLLPAVKKARLSLAESLNTGLADALRSCLNSASVEDKKIMLESLNNLHINVSEDCKEVSSAVNNGEDLVSQLQEALKSNRSLEQQVSELQEKLSVCYAKEAKQEEQLTKYKSSIAKLGDGVRAAKGLQERNDFLTEELAKKEKLIVDKEKQINDILYDAKASRDSNKSLLEDISNKSSTISKLMKNIEDIKNESEQEKQTLLENIEEMKKDSEIKRTQYNNSLKKCNDLVEKYKGVAKASMNKYIECKARMIGVTPQEIKNRLEENYSFSDIDNVCEGLRSYQLNVGALPFDLSSSSKRVVVKESVEPIRPKNTDVDDEVDNDLLRMAGLD